MSICADCTLPYSRAWSLAERKEIMERLINAYKFERVRAAADIFADMLDEYLPELPDTTVVVPVPTIPRHVRQRGYDHTYLVAQKIARKRKLSCSSLIYRKKDTVQLGKSRRRRMKQADESFGVRGRMDSGKIYLLFDDIFTTGATVNAAANLLRQAGACEVWVVILARQPLDDRGNY